MVEPVVTTRRKLVGIECLLIEIERGGAKVPVERCRRHRFIGTLGFYRSIDLVFQRAYYSAFDALGFQYSREFVSCTEEFGYLFGNVFEFPSEIVSEIYYRFMQ